MLTTDERWRINHAAQLMAAAEALLGDIIVRSGDPDSANVRDIARSQSECVRKTEDLRSRLGTIATPTLCRYRKILTLAEQA